MTQAWDLHHFEGLVMGTRFGRHVTLSVATFIMAKENLSPKEMDNILNKKSGLLGISGISNDIEKFIRARRKKSKSGFGN